MTSKSSFRLKGKCVLVTRSFEGNKIEREKLEKLGAEVVDLPSIELGPPSNFKKIDMAIDGLSEFDWIVFTSANGVRAFFERLKLKRREKNEIKAKFACIGPETQKALEIEGFKPTFVPSEFLTRTLGREMSSAFGLKGERVLLARAEEASKEITENLEKAGAMVVDAPVYKTIPKRIDFEILDSIIDGITDITLTSPSTVKGLTLNYSNEEIRARNIRIHCIGPVTAQSAKNAGLEVSTIARVHTIDGMIEEMISSLPV